METLNNKTSVTKLNTVISNIIDINEIRNINILNDLNKTFKDIDLNEYDYKSFVAYAVYNIDNKIISNDKKAYYKAMFKLLSLNKFYKLNLNKIQFYILLQDTKVINKLISKIDKIDKVIKLFKCTYYDLFLQSVNDKKVNFDFISKVISNVNKELTKIKLDTTPTNKEDSKPTIEADKVDTTEVITPKQAKEEVKTFSREVSLNTLKKDLELLHDNNISKYEVIAVLNAIYGE